MIINEENIFLIILGLIWIIGAVMQDLKRREVDNLWNFSLIFFALSYRATVSIFNWDYWFFLNGIMGLVIFIILGNLFYYSRLFAGGDAKLLMALGVILPFSYDWIINLKLFLLFILLFLVCGSFYAIFYSFFLVFKNWKNFNKEFKKQFKNYKYLFFISMISFIILIFFGFFFEKMIFLFAFVILFFPVLFVFAKSVEESCMIRLIQVSKLTIGDWLYKDIKVGNKKIESNWEGVSEEELKLIQKKYKKKILIKQGIPFTPSFLLGLLVLIYLAYNNYFSIL
jgi:Flp pilus assembly protein protease CpaA